MIRWMFSTIGSVLKRMTKQKTLKNQWIRVDNIGRYFEDLGYKIIAPEDYTLSEQLNLYLSCTEFASTAGSASHNTLFLREGTKVFIIPRMGGFITRYQLAIDTIYDFDITYIDSTLSLYVSPTHPWGGPFYYIISENLQDYFGVSTPYKEKKFEFFVYRHLAFSMTRVKEPSGYFDGTYQKYLSVNPVTRDKYNLFCRALVRFKIQKRAALLLKHIEEISLRRKRRR